MSDVIIKRLDANNAEIYFNLRLESLKNSPTSFLSSYDEAIKSGPDFYIHILNNHDNTNVIFGALKNNQLVGIVGVYQETHNRLKHKSTLWGMYVTKDMRHHGIAKKLIDAAITHARDKMCCSSINLTVGSLNIAAKKLYETLGFKTWGIEKKAFLIDGDYVDEDHMVLHLN